MAAKVRHLLDLPWIYDQLRAGMSVTDIYKREYSRLLAVADFEPFTVGTISRIAMDWRQGIKEAVENAPKNYDTYIYGVEPPKPGALPKFVGHERLTGNWLILSDTHCPYVDFDVVAEAVRDAKMMGIENVLIAGDIANGDSASPHKSILPKPTPEQERESIRELISYLVGNMDLVLLTPGNHDRWAIYRSEGHYTFGQMMLAAVGYDYDNLLVSEYDRAYLKSNQVSWVIPHQTNYSVRSGSVGEALINKYRANVIVPHQHYFGFTTDRNNHNVCLEIGGVYRAELFAYSSLVSKSSTHEMGRAYALVSDGVGHLVTEDDRAIVRSFRTE